MLPECSPTVLTTPTFPGDPRCPLFVSCPPQFAPLSASNGKTFTNPLFKSPQRLPRPANSVTEKVVGTPLGMCSSTLSSLWGRVPTLLSLRVGSSVFPDLGFRKPEPMRKGPETWRELGSHTPRCPPTPYTPLRPRSHPVLLSEWPEPSPLPLGSFEMGGMQLSDPHGPSCEERLETAPLCSDAAVGSYRVSDCSPVG